MGATADRRDRLDDLLERDVGVAERGEVRRLRRGQGGAEGGRPRDLGTHHQRVDEHADEPVTADAVRPAVGVPTATSGVPAIRASNAAKAVCTTMNMVVSAAVAMACNVPATRPGR